MTITLRDDLLRKAEKRAADSGYATVAEYVEALIQTDTSEEITEEEFARGDADFAAGRGRPMEAAIRELAAKHGIPLDEAG
jgi:predicted transcriptional regulator